jgi:hypothetical protein
VYTAAEKHLQTLVNTLRLTIGLGVVCRASQKRSAMQLEQLLPKPTDENSVSIRDNRPRHTMQVHHIHPVSPLPPIWL